MKYAYINPDGGLTIVSPSTQYLKRILHKFKNKYDAIEYIGKEAARKAGHTIYIGKVINDPNLSREFRDAWILSNDNEIKISIKKAIEIHKNKIRSYRQAILDKLDKELLRANEQDNIEETKLIIQEKQRLRDLPATLKIDNASTVEELKSLWDISLGANPYKNDGV